MSTIPSKGPAPELAAAPAFAPSESVLSSVLAGEIARLANQMFMQGPGGGDAPSSGSPSWPASVPASAEPSDLRPAGAHPAGVSGPGAFGPITQTAEPAAVSRAPFDPLGATRAPTGALPPTRFGPSALNQGGGGASPAVRLPPVPGAVASPPIANAPPPRESDLRGVTALYAENFHGTSAVPLLTQAESGPSDQPYFLQLAGLPSGGGTPTPTPPGVSVPGAAPFGPHYGQPDRHSLPALHSLPDLHSQTDRHSQTDLHGQTDRHSQADLHSQTYRSSQTDRYGHTDRSSQPDSVAGPDDRRQAGRSDQSDPYHQAERSDQRGPARQPDYSSRSDYASVPARSAGPDHPSQSEHTQRDLRGSNEHRTDLRDGFSPSERSGQTTRLPRADSIDHGYVPNLTHVREAPGTPAPRPFDPYAIRRDFPILNERVHGKRLVWLDNAATTQKPQSVIDRLSYFYEHENSNIHRAAHTLAARATDAYEGAREKVARFLNAGSSKEIVFTRGTTESINLVAKAWGGRYLSAGDEVIITWLEHHANIVPWQMICKEKGAKLRVVPVDDSGQVILAQYAKLLGPRTKMVAVTQVSNALGTITPAAVMVQMAKAVGATTMVDGAQAVSHMRADVTALDCDFYTFSGHKVFGPTGIGALYGKPEALEATPPWQGGGNMIADVTFEETRYNPPPFRFEADTGNSADAVGLGAALDYVESIGIDNVSAYEHALLEYGTHHLTQIPGLRMIGTAAEKAGVMSFVIDGLNTEQLGGALDKEGVAVRSGHHCAQPILRRFGVEHTVRASLAPYNTTEDLDILVAAVRRLAQGRGRR